MTFVLHDQSTTPHYLQVGGHIGFHEFRTVTVTVVLDIIVFIGQYNAFMILQRAIVFGLFLGFIKIVFIFMFLWNSTIIIIMNSLTMKP